MSEPTPTPPPVTEKTADSGRTDVPRYGTWNWGHWLLWILSWVGIVLTWWHSSGPPSGAEMRPYDPDDEDALGPLTMPNMERPPDEPRGYPTRFDM